MGDVAMAAPVLEAMARRYPDLRMTLLTRDFFAPFFDGVPGLHIHAIDLNGRHKGIGGLWRLFREVRSHGPIDAVIDLHSKLYSWVLDGLFFLSGVPVFRMRKGRAEKRALTRRENKRMVQLKTSVERYADTFRAAGFEVEVSATLQRRERPLPALLGEKQEPWIGLSPFAQHLGKRYPLYRVEAVIEQLRLLHPRAVVLLFGGGAEEKRVAEELVARHPNCRSLVGKLSLREELDVMAHLELMVSMDSSAMHMASLVGVPVVSIWGATHPYAGFLGLGQSPDDAVGTAIECRPCSVYGSKPCWRGDYACLGELPPEQVLDRILRRMEE